MQLKTINFTFRLIIQDKHKWQGTFMWTTLLKYHKTFGQHEKFVLDSAIGNMLYVPAGFAHGFVALEETIFVYKCTDYWNKSSESGIIYNDNELNIDWCIENPIVSAKDLLLPKFSEIKSLTE